MADPVTPVQTGAVERPEDAIRTSAAKIGSDFVGVVREQAATYVETRRTDAVKAVSGIADAIRASSEGFGDRPHLKAFFDEAAAGVSDVSDAIAERDLGTVYAEVEAAVRQRPLFAAAAAAVAGFALMRLLKASPPGAAATSPAVPPAA